MKLLYRIATRVLKLDQRVLKRSVRVLVKDIKYGGKGDPKVRVNIEPIDFDENEDANVHAFTLYKGDQVEINLDVKLEFENLQDKKGPIK